MARQNISLGTAANDRTGDPLRTAFTKVNANFTELYSIGVQGTQGIQGRQGIQGIQGTQGQQGIQGVQGIQGIRAAEDRLINGSYEVVLNANGAIVHPTAPGPVEPATSNGVAGDTIGSVIFGFDYIYVCVGVYTDGTDDIWKRVAWSNETW